MASSVGFVREILDVVLGTDGLHVVARGLGVPALLCRLLCRALADHRGQLVFLLNVQEDEEDHLLTQLIEDGAPHLPRFMRADCSIAERTEWYRQGGCLAVSPRNLIVDLLHHRVPIHLIWGFIVTHAHRVDEDSAEAFILRLFREKNRGGFIKAFSESPEHFASDGGRLAKTLAALQVPTVSLWPRFQLSVLRDLERVKVDVVEVFPRMGVRMTEVQTHITDIVTQVLLELKHKVLPLSTPELLSLENVLTGELFKAIRQELGPSSHTMPASTRRLVEDLRALRDLLLALYSSDCVAFHQYLANLVAASRSSLRAPGLDPLPSEWVLMDAAAHLLKAARERVFVLTRKRLAEDPPGAESVGGAGGAFDNRLRLILEADPKWEALAEVLAEARGGPPGKVLIMVHTDRTRAQLAEVLCAGGRAYLSRQFRRYVLQAYPAVSPHPTAAPAATEVDRVLQAEADAIRRHCPGFSAPPPPPPPPPAPVANHHHHRPSGPPSKDLESPAPNKRRRPGRSLAEKVAMAKDAAASSGTVVQREPAAPTRGLRRRPIPRPVPGPGGGCDQAMASDPEDDRPCAGAPPAAVAVGRPDPDPSSELERWFGVREDPPVQICTYAAAGGLLQSLGPRYVVMYDADLAFVRQLEVHAAAAAAMMGPPVRAYLLVHDRSAEQQRFLALVDRERRAFQSLVRAKATLVPGADERFGRMDPKERELQVLALAPSGATSRRGGATLTNLQPTAKGSVVVDMREFRSSLPSQLHARGLTVLPLTLGVGDYVLTPTVCVERKSVADLYQSLASGRLHHQVEAMARCYPTPILLIEFSKQHPFNLLGHPHRGSLPGPLGVPERLALLAIHFPALRLLWCRTPQVTAQAFVALKEGRPEPDPNLAARAGGGSGDPSDAADAAAAGGGEGDALAAEELLRQLPGVTASNVIRLMAAFPTLRAVLRAPQARLVDALGPVDGRALFAFLRRTAWADAKEGGGGAGGGDGEAPGS